MFMTTLKKSICENVLFNRCRILKAAKSVGMCKNSLSTLEGFVPKPLSEFSVVKLSSKSVIRLSGADVYPFMQGLITNDMQCLEHDCTSVYSQLLTIKGRVLCDIILYKDDTDVLVEVDNTQKETLIRVLKKYKIRKKIKIDDVSESISAFAAFGCQKEKPNAEGQPFTVHRDPRLLQLGWRLLASPTSQLEQEADEMLYHRHRYRLGVGEGPLEHLPEKALPLECNLLLLNGVSFNKGCFVGQELTSRSHHTGVIRKRIMPVRTTPTAFVSAYTDVKLLSTDKMVGAIRSMEGGYGVALLRVNDVLKPGATLYTTDTDGSKVDIQTHRPDWWPDGVGVV